MRALLPVVVVVMALAPGCRCSSSAPAEPASTAPSARPASSADSCPPTPDWGLPTPEPDHLVAELLMQPDTATAKGTGTGIRIYDDGRVFAHDHVAYEMEDGKLVAHPLVPAWHQHRTLGAMRLDELRTAIASVDVDGLTGWHGANRDKSKNRPSFLTVQRDGKPLRSCYRGLELGEGQKRVDTVVKKLMGEAFDASVRASALKRN